MSQTTTRFIARQAILDRQQRSIGYELLYRTGNENFANLTDRSMASKSTIDRSFLFGLDLLCGDCKAFVNCSADVLISDYIRTAPAPKTVLEVLEGEMITDEVVEGCKRLKQAGYELALDDFAGEDGMSELIPLADILKIDIQAINETRCNELVNEFGKTHKLVAEKVETREEFKRVFDAGFDYFQGYYFQKPEILSKRDLSPNLAIYVQLLEAANNPNMDFSRIEQIIKSDAALCYRLLRYLNSAVFCLQSSVTSIRHSLSLLGEREIRRWVSLVAMACAGNDKPHELIKSALLRAKLGGALSVRARCREYDAFLYGMFSLMDTILGVTMADIISKVEMPSEVALALKGKPNRLHNLIDLIQSYESGNWESCDRLCAEMTIDSHFLSDSYRDALVWVDKLTAQT